jgi:uncharacterized protein YbjQ (UPF0145 family)
MEFRQFAKDFGIADKKDFAKWLSGSSYSYKKSAFHDSVDYWEIEDGQNFEQIVAAYQNSDLQKVEERAQSQAADKKKQAALANMLVTSGFNFDGYTISKYSGYISGDDVTQVARGTDLLLGIGARDVGAALTDSLVTIRRNALQELKEAAYALGCNAVIGVDFDYITLDPETARLGGGTVYQPYVFCVTANGNAVVIEKNAPSAT